MMNPSNPTAAEMRDIEQVFFAQMRKQTRYATRPGLREREAMAEALLRSFDFQFSDQWMTA